MHSGGCTRQRARGCVRIERFGVASRVSDNVIFERLRESCACKVKFPEYPEYPQGRLGLRRRLSSRARARGL